MVPKNGWPKPSFKFHSAGGKRRRTQATNNALEQYVKGAGSPSQIASAVAAFEHEPTWKAAVSALKAQQIPSKAMAVELNKVLRLKCDRSLADVISAVKNGRGNTRAADVVLAVKIFIMNKYQGKCGGLFR